MDHRGLRDRGRRPDLDRISRAPPSTAPSRLFPARSRRRAPLALPHLRPSIPIQCAIRHLSRSNHLFGGCAARSTRASLNSGRARECRPYSSGRRHQCLRHTRAVSRILGLFRPQRPVRRRPPSCAAPGAFALILTGVKRQSALLRWQALILFGLAVAKVFLYDISYLDRFYRIVSLLILGVLLLVVSFLYQKKTSRERSTP